MKTPSLQHYVTTQVCIETYPNKAGCTFPDCNCKDSRAEFFRLIFNVVCAVRNYDAEVARIRPEILKDIIAAALKSHSSPTVGTHLGVRQLGWTVWSETIWAVAAEIVASSIFSPNRADSPEAKKQE